MDPLTAPAPLVSASDLSASSDRIRHVLKRLSWGAPASVMLLFVLTLVGFYHLWAKPLAHVRAENFQRQSIDTMTARVEATADQIDRIVLTMRDWAKAGVVRLDDVPALNRTMMPVLWQRSIVSSIHLADASGREVLLLKTADGWRNRVTHVPLHGAQQQWLTWKDDRTLLDEEWKTQDYDPRKRPWYTGVMSAPENVVYWTAPYLFATTQEPGITAAVRWTDAESGLTQVVAFDVLLSDLSALTLGMPYTDRGGVALLSAEDKVLGLPRDAGFDTPQAVQQAVLQSPADIGLTTLARALRANPAQYSSDLGVLVDGPGAPWRVLIQPMPLRNQPFRLALMAPNEVFSVWSQRIWWALLAALTVLGLTAGYVARRLLKQVAEPVGALFEQLGNSNQELAARALQAAQLAVLTKDLQKASSFDALGQVLLSRLAQFTRMGFGSLYVADESQHMLKRWAGFAISGEVDLPAHIAYGEGLLGQCALDRQVICLDQPPAGYVRLRSALLSGAPACLLLWPVINNARLQGVLELALLQPLSCQEQALLTELMPTLALCMEILERGDNSQRLLEETRQQALALRDHAGLAFTAKT